jgi:hypothetical protein
MGGQIILTTDPSGLSSPFLSNETKQMCLNASEWVATQQAFKDVAFQLGCMMLVTGFIIGALAVYGYYRMKDDGSSE